jgi:hypothetical protein
MGVETKMKFGSVFLILAMVFFLPSSVGAASEDDVATFYRTSPVIENARIHIATFDTGQGKDNFKYNWKNCMYTAKLYQAQPGILTKFWCEKGFYKE